MSLLDFFAFCLILVVAMMIRFMKHMRGLLLKKLILISSTSARLSLDIFTGLVIKEIGL